jgi:hypothetical protein
MSKLVGDFLCAFNLHKWKVRYQSRTITRFFCVREGCDAERYEVDPL